MLCFNIVFPPEILLADTVKSIIFSMYDFFLAETMVKALHLTYNMVEFLSSIVCPCYGYFLYQRLFGSLEEDF